MKSKFDINSRSEEQNFLKINFDRRRKNLIIMTKTRETIRRERAEAARQKKRDEAFRAATSRRGTRTGLRSGREIQEPDVEHLEHQTADVEVQTLLSGPVVQAMDRTFPITIKMLFCLMVGLFGLIYYFYCQFQ